MCAVRKFERYIKTMSLSDRILQKELCKSTYLGYWTPPEGEKEMTAEEVTRYERSKIRAYLSPNPGFVRVVDGKVMPLTYMPILDFTEDTEKPLRLIAQRLKQFKENEEMSYALTVTGSRMIKEDGEVKFAYDTSGRFSIVTDAVIPEIEDVQSINDKVVIVKFADGTSEKAVLSENDTFSLEQGVSICITKKILNKVLKGANGTSAYNKLVDYGLKVYDKKQKEIKEAIAAKKAEKDAEQRKIDRIRKKRAKHKAKLREEQIEIQAEAYRRAMKSE